MDVPEPCKKGLSKECFELYPEWAKQMFAQRMLRLLLPPWLTRLLYQWKPVLLEPPQIPIVTTPPVPTPPVPVTPVPVTPVPVTPVPVPVTPVPVTPVPVTPVPVTPVPVPVTPVPVTPVPVTPVPVTPVPVPVTPVPVTPVPIIPELPIIPGQEIPLLKEPILPMPDPNPPWPPPPGPPHPVFPPPPVEAEVAWFTEDFNTLDLDVWAIKDGGPPEMACINGQLVFDVEGTERQRIYTWGAITEESDYDVEFTLKYAEWGSSIIFTFGASTSEFLIKFSFDPEEIIVTSGANSKSSDTGFVGAKHSYLAEIRGQVLTLYQDGKIIIGNLTLETETLDFYYVQVYLYGFGKTYIDYIRITQTD